MLAMLGALLPRLPRQRPRHLLGVADERGVPPSVALGIDTFDSCYPTRLGRHGTLLTPRGRLKIGQKQYRDMHAPPPGFEDDLVPGTLTLTLTLTPTPTLTLTPTPTPTPTLTLKVPGACRLRGRWRAAAAAYPGVPAPPVEGQRAAGLPAARTLA